MLFWLDHSTSAEAKTVLGILQRAKIRRRSIRLAAPSAAALIRDNKAAATSRCFRAAVEPSASCNTIPFRLPRQFGMSDYRSLFETGAIP
jgi:hypothetical protein